MEESTFGCFLFGKYYMDYRQIYKKLIDRAQDRVLEGYVERHHIIPKCLQGADDPSNIVSLTPEEHYLAHLLLVRIHPHVKGLLYAVKLMSGQGNNKKYGWVKRRLSETGFTQEHKDNLSNAQKEKADSRTLEDLKARWAKGEAKRQSKKDSTVITALIYAIT